jgi:hypothetical protein
VPSSPLARLGHGFGRARPPVGRGMHACALASGHAGATNLGGCLKEAALFAAGRYGISIDFGLEAVEKDTPCGETFKLKVIDLTIKPRLTINPS